MLKYLFFILLTITFLLPFSVSAQEFAFPGFPIVPCGRTGQPDCKLCHLFVMAKNIIDWILAFIIVIAPVFILIGGIVILTAAGKPDQVALGKRMITSAIIGVAIGLLSWTILSTLFNTLVGETGFPWPWNNPNCPV
jgi:hypothetical protein